MQAYETSGDENIFRLPTKQQIAEIEKLLLSIHGRNDICFIIYLY